MHSKHCQAANTLQCKRIKYKTWHKHLLRHTANMHPPVVNVFQTLSGHHGRYSLHCKRIKYKTWHKHFLKKNTQTVHHSWADPWKFVGLVLSTLYLVTHVKFFYIFNLSWFSKNNRWNQNFWRNIHPAPWPTGLGVPAAVGHYGRGAANGRQYWLVGPGPNAAAHGVRKS
jgi:hypothetical protein